MYFEILKYKNIEKLFPKFCNTEKSDNFGNPKNNQMHFQIVKCTNIAVPVHNRMLFWRNLFLHGSTGVKIRLFIHH